MDLKALTDDEFHDLYFDVEVEMQRRLKEAHPMEYYSFKGTWIYGCYAQNENNAYDLLAKASGSLNTTVDTVEVLPYGAS